MNLNLFPSECPFKCSMARAKIRKVITWWVSTITLISGPVVFANLQIFVLPEVVAKTYNQILEKTNWKCWVGTIKWPIFLQIGRKGSIFIVVSEFSKGISISFFCFCILLFFWEEFSKWRPWQNPLVYSTELSVIKNYQKAMFSQE